MERPSIGQTIRWHSNDSSSHGEAVVDAVRSDRMEGLGPEVEEYAASWLEVEGSSGAKAGERYTLMLATDGKVYLDGNEVRLVV